MNLNKELTSTDALIKLSPSTYWIGDLSYVMSKHWDRVCDQMVDADEEHDGLFEIDGFNLWLHSTEYGDGIYQAKKNTLLKSKTPRSGFCVDAGIIGIVPLALTDGTNADYSAGMTVTFADVISCAYDEGLYSFKSGGKELVIDGVPSILRALEEA